jgi:gamma-glutamylaminecyclotransferase
VFRADAVSALGETYQRKKVNTVTTLSASPACISVHHRAASYGNSLCRVAPTGADSLQGAFSSPPDIGRATADGFLESQAPKAELQAPKTHKPHSRFHVVEGVQTKPPQLRDVFVYGSLLPGLHNNGMLRDATFLGYRKTSPNFEMFSLTQFPAVCGEGTTAISGALYHVNDATLRRLDQLEGHPHWYRRQLVDLEASALTAPQRAWMYVMPREEPEVRGGWVSPVPSGDWFAYHTGQRVNTLAG